MTHVKPPDSAPEMSELTEPTMHDIDAVAETHLAVVDDDAPPPKVKRFRWSDVLGPLVVFVIFIAGWYLLAHSIENNFSEKTGKPLLVPYPHQLFWGVNDVRPKIVEATLLTAKTAALGLAIAIVIGMSLAILMSQARWVERALWPYLIALQAIPILALVPLLINFFGNNFRSRVIVTVLICLFPIVSNTLFGLLAADRNQHDLFTLNGASRTTRLTKLQLPGAMPAVFTGFRISAGLSVIGAVVGDFFFAKGSPGLGKLINDYFLNNQASRMFVCAMLSAFLGITFFVFFGWLGNRVVGKWYEASRPGQ